METVDPLVDRRSAVPARLVLRVTVCDPRSGRTTELTLDAPVGSRVREVRAAVLEAAVSGPGHGEVLRVGGVSLHDDQVLGRPPLVQGAVLVVDHDGADGGRAAPGVPAAPGLLAAHVVAGPDAGAVATLPPGSHRIGRAGEVRIADRDISRVHAVLEVGPAGTSVRDAGSRHGTLVEGEPVGAQPRRLAAGDRVVVGGSTVVVRPPEPPAHVLPDGLGHLLVNPRPHLPRPAPTARVEFPVLPEPPRPTRPALLATLLPLGVSVLLAVVLRQPVFLLFALVAPAMTAGQYLADRRGGTRLRRIAARTHAEETERARAQLARALAEDAAHDEEDLPDLARISCAARLPGVDLWHRTGPLRVRLGHSTRASRVTVSDAPTDLACEAGHALHGVVATGLTLTDGEVVGVCGPTAERVALARSVLGQLATLHSPDRVGIEVLTDREGATTDWAWTGWLPHHRAARPGTTRVVLLDGASRLRRDVQVAALLAGAAECATVVLCLDESAALLPRECTTTIELSDTRSGGTGDGAVVRQAGAAPYVVRPDLPSAAWAERLARGLAPLRDGSTPVVHGGAACSPSMLDLLSTAEGVRADDPADLLRHWARRRSPEAGPSACLGIRTDDGRPVRIDLRRDGPHVLIGGTTGAGKSGLLLALLLGLAVDASPEETTVLLVDYKGGAAFGGCTHLPHVAGLLTDLDPHLARRAITALRAELHRRERLLAGTGVADLDGYRAERGRRLGGHQAGDPLPALPRLVILVDEFRVLREELPEFVDGLVRVAAVGRSLGVHLVLATQRPAGAVSPEIRANTALRIALRVRDDADSRDLIESPAAAQLPPESPGRALARCADGALLDFRTASVWAGRQAERPALVRRTGSAAVPTPPGTAAGPDAMAAVPTAARAACTLAGLPAAQAPWLPQLPQRLDLPESALRPAEGPVVAVLGRSDEPAHRRQELCDWRPGHGHLAVVGGPRSGRTTALLGVAGSLAARYGPDRVHLYAITTDPASMAGLLDLPQVGCVVPAADVQRCARLLARIVARLDDGPGDDADRPVLVLLIDGWEGLLASWNQVEHGRWVDVLLGVLRDGGRHGVHVVISGGRSVLTGQVSGLAGARLVLPFPDPSDAVIAGVPRALQDLATVPGRGVLIDPAHPDGIELQVASALRPIPFHAPSGGAWPAPWRLPELPRRVRLDQAAGGTAAVTGRGLSVPIGLGGDDVEPVHLELDNPGVTLVHGVPGSGRSTALATLTASARAAGVGVVVLREPGALAAATTTAPDDDTVLVLDDVADPLPDALEALVAERLARRPERPRVVLASGTGDLVTAYRGLLTEARAARNGLLLGPPSPQDAGVLGMGAPGMGMTGVPGMGTAAGRRDPPGRGVLVHGRHVVTVQVALPP